MVSAHTISCEVNPDPADLARIRDGLTIYNRQLVGEDNFAPVTLLVRNESGTLVGGLLGGTYWGWLVIEILWLAHDARHQGLGSQLLHRAEAIAMARGCHGAHLDTMSFQAPDFYEKHGYTVFGVLDNLPQGHKRYFLRKDLPSHTLHSDVDGESPHVPAQRCSSPD